MITLYGFGDVTPEVQGLTRDLRALWALEETGLDYRVHPLDDMQGELKRDDYMAVNPFGMIPTIVDDGFTLFESGAIVFYIADKAGKLLPEDAEKRAMALQWGFAALTTLEPPITTLAANDFFFADEPLAKAQRPGLVKAAQGRLKVIEKELVGQDYIMGDEFAAPDILLVTVLREIQHTDLLDAFPNTSAYKARCEARPAWKKVIAAYEQRLAA